MVRYGAEDHSRVISRWQEEKILAAAESRAPCMKSVYEHLGYGRSFASKVIREFEAAQAGSQGGFQELQPCRTSWGGARNTLFGEEELAYLAALVDAGHCATAEDYQRVLALEVGIDASIRSINRALLVDLDAHLVEAQQNTIDKYSDESLLRLTEFIEETSLIERRRLRFYDQTGVSYRQLLYTRRRKRKGGPKPHISTPSSQGKHYSYFGLTSTEPWDMPVTFKAYTSDLENGQGKSCSKVATSAFARSCSSCRSKIHQEVWPSVRPKGREQGLLWCWLCRRVHSLTGHIRGVARTPGAYLQECSPIPVYASSRRELEQPGKRASAELGLSESVAFSICDSSVVALVGLSRLPPMPVPAFAD
eukprot:scaffold739_cov166-Pinguiococcus_pyrenoidosus.AAC.11